MSALNDSGFDMILSHAYIFILCRNSPNCGLDRLILCRNGPNCGLGRLILCRNSPNCGLGRLILCRNSPNCGLGRLILCRNSPNCGPDHPIFDLHRSHKITQTPARTPLNGWSARRTGRSLHKTQQAHETNFHALSGVRTRHPRNRAAEDMPYIMRLRALARLCI